MKRTIEEINQRALELGVAKIVYHVTLQSKDTDNIIERTTDDLTKLFDGLNFTITTELTYVGKHLITEGYIQNGYDYEDYYAVIDKEVVAC